MDLSKIQEFVMSIYHNLPIVFFLKPSNYRQEYHRIGARAWLRLEDRTEVPALGKRLKNDIGELMILVIF